MKGNKRFVGTPTTRTDVPTAATTIGPEIISSRTSQQTRQDRKQQRSLRQSLERPNGSRPSSQTVEREQILRWLWSLSRRRCWEGYSFPHTNHAASYFGSTGNVFRTDGFRTDELGFELSTEGGRRDCWWVAWVLKGVATRQVRTWSRSVQISSPLSAVSHVSTKGSTAASTFSTTGFPATKLAVDTPSRPIAAVFKNPALLLLLPLLLLAGALFGVATMVNPEHRRRKGSAAAAHETNLGRGNFGIVGCGG